MKDTNGPTTTVPTGRGSTAGEAAGAPAADGRGAGHPREGRVPLKVVVSAYAVPVLVLVQFAWLATLPVLVLLVSTLHTVRSRALRGLAVLLTVVYAVPYAVWKLRPDPAPSLSKDISPVLAGLVVAVSVVFVLALHVVPRRASRRR